LALLRMVRSSINIFRPKHALPHGVRSRLAVEVHVLTIFQNVIAKVAFDL
jgi:hypothetical protein